jgi:predicted nuclease with TOPRIM domain
MSDDAPNAQADPLESDEETDQLALAAVEAIKRLMAERNALRGRLISLEHEVTRLRDHVTLIRDSYRRLANELVTQLELVDNFDREVAQERARPIEFRRFLGIVPPKAT